MAHPVTGRVKKFHVVAYSCKVNRSLSRLPAVADQHVSRILATCRYLFLINFLTWLTSRSCLASGQIGNSVRMKTAMVQRQRHSFRFLVALAHAHPARRRYHRLCILRRSERSIRVDQYQMVPVDHLQGASRSLITAMGIHRFHVQGRRSTPTIRMDPDRLRFPMVVVRRHWPIRSVFTLTAVLLVQWASHLHCLPVFHRLQARVTS